LLLDIHKRKGEEENKGECQLFYLRDSPQTHLVTDPLSELSSSELWLSTTCCGVASFAVLRVRRVGAKKQFYVDIEIE
jgi:hypothetical protein